MGGGCSDFSLLGYAYVHVTVFWVLYCFVLLQGATTRNDPKTKKRWFCVPLSFGNKALIPAPDLKEVKHDFEEKEKGWISI